MTVSYQPIVKAPSLRAAFCGQIYNGVERYCNVKYATIPHRFELPQLKTSWGPNDPSSRCSSGNLTLVDCSRQGPICPQATPYEDSLIGIKPENVIPFDLVYDELECAQLMITRPVMSGGDQQSLPVVVWIHGGGNMAGTPYRHVNNPADWVRRGAETGEPFIFVSVQYRLHLFGFLPFNGKGNFGLHDQRTALEWVQRYIHHFGGNPSNVTLAGQSAGSCCVANHICAGASLSQALFHRAALLSGSIESMPAQSLESYEKKAQKIVQALGVSSVSELQTVEAEKLVQAASKIGMEVAMPVDDGVFMPPGMYGRLSPDLLEGSNRQLQSVITADCIEDAYFFEEYLPKDAKTVYDLAKQQLGTSAEATETLFQAYGISEANVRTRVCDILTDALFCNGNERTDLFFRNNSTTKVFRQFFDAINPFSPEYGNNHMVEILYMLNAYGVPETKLATTHAIQDRWIQFFYGKDPWDKHSVLYASPGGQVEEIDWNKRSDYRRLGQFAALAGLNREFLAQVCALD